MKESAVVSAERLPLLRVRGEESSAVLLSEVSVPNSLLLGDAGGGSRQYRQRPNRQIESVVKSKEFSSNCGNFHPAST